MYTYKYMYMYNVCWTYTCMHVALINPNSLSIVTEQ